MTSDLTPLLDHDLSDDCPVCRAQEVIQIALLPAAAAWELNNDLPRFSIALHGAAELLGAMLLVPAPDTRKAAYAPLAPPRGCDGVFCYLRCYQKS